MKPQPAKPFGATEPPPPSAAIDEDAPADTPAERRKRKVRDAIIEAAEDVFAAEGEAGLSMRRLADKIDYSPAAIYKYFSSKDELLSEIREQFFERMAARMEASDAKGARDVPRDVHGFRAILKAYIQTGLDNPNHYRMAFGALGGGPPRQGSRAYESITSFNALTAELTRNGAFREVDPDLASKSVWASLHGLTLILASIPHFPEGVDGCGTATADQLIDFHVEQICRGLMRAPG